jgi:PTH1 family peptidyl-tRNA hydrolase
VKLVAGLGNPGPQHAQSRHNMGFFVVAELAQRWGLPPARYERAWEGTLSAGQRADQRVLLLQPQTYMNASGRSVAAVWRYYQLDLADLLVVLDDLDLPLGRLRLRAGGSSGGHKGLTDVIRHLGSDEFARLRLGIGRVPRRATVEYVLGRFGPQEREDAAAAVRAGADAGECWLDRGLAAAMNAFNRRRPAPEAGPSAPDGPSQGDAS